MNFSDFNKNNENEHISFNDKNVRDNDFYKHLHSIFGNDDIFDKNFNDVHDKITICHSIGLECLDTVEKYCKFFLWYSKECFLKDKKNNGNAAIQKVFDLIHHTHMPSVMPILHHYVKLVPSPQPLSPTMLEIYDNHCSISETNPENENDNDDILTQIIPLENDL